MKQFKLKFLLKNYRNNNNFFLKTFFKNSLKCKINCTVFEELLKYFNVIIILDCNKSHFIKKLKNNFIILNNFYFIKYLKLIFIFNMLNLYLNNYIFLSPFSILILNI